MTITAIPVAIHGTVTVSYLGGTGYTYFQMGNCPELVSTLNTALAAAAGVDPCSNVGYNINPSVRESVPSITIGSICLCVPCGPRRRELEFLRVFAHGDTIHVGIDAPLDPSHERCRR